MRGLPAKVSMFASAAIGWLVATAAHATELPAVIPVPAHMEWRTGVFAIRADTRVAIPRDSGAARVAGYFADLMQKTRGLRLQFGSAARPIVFELHKGTEAAKSNPESYTLDVSPTRIVLSASDPRGLFYAAVTLWQLTTSGPAADTISVPAVHIVDSPRFAWRGMLLDSARHYQSPEFILQFIDWMALHKLNVFHWHLTDDQAWRLEIKKYPRLTGVGAWRVPAGAAPAADIDPATGKPRLYGGFYSQDTVRKIVAHAAERNITVVPEIDLPGHATAAVVAYPRLASIVPAPAAVPSDWGVYFNLYNADEGTLEFLENVLTEVVQLFPGQFVHIGGDEAVKDQWKASPRIQERMRQLGVANEADLQRYFIERIGKFLTRHHRRLIGWDEILEGGIPHDAAIMSWRGVDGAYSAAAAGHDAVLSPSPTLYFDNRQSATDTQPGRGHVTSLEDVYKFDPMPASLAPDQRQHILGLQANIWTEHIRTEKRVEYMAFPRVAAVAEVGWSPAASLNWNDFLARLPEQRRRYESMGITAYPGASQVEDASRPVAGLSSHQLKSCTDKVLLSLEDDAPLNGPRAAFLVDIMNPCWIYPAADLTADRSLQAAVGQVPFNFQLGADIHSIKLTPPQTPYGELEVRLDNCDGERVATLSLQPALANNGVTRLPAASIARRAGKHDLCLKFTQRSLDPMWVIDRVRLE
ncbi:MAG: family 20 glycosylhydrolase [Proteobacteria bacterium]|nr:family 20 glycosylhydrolase [Pseudomonadota bacterium]